MRGRTATLPEPSQHAVVATGHRLAPPAGLGRVERSALDQAVAGTVDRTPFPHQHGRPDHAPVPVPVDVLVGRHRLQVHELVGPGRQHRHDGDPGRGQLEQLGRRPRGRRRAAGPRRGRRPGRRVGRAVRRVQTAIVTATSASPAAATPARRNEGRRAASRPDQPGPPSAGRPGARRVEDAAPQARGQLVGRRGQVGPELLEPVQVRVHRSTSGSMVGSVPPRASRTLRRARFSRDRTVPSGMSSAVATSS